MVKTMKISARNQIPGTVKTIKKGPVSTEVVITVAGGNVFRYLTKSLDI